MNVDEIPSVASVGGESNASITTLFAIFFDKEKIYDRAAALESIMVSACWPPQRKFDHNLISEDENVCPHCSVVGCDELHQYWTCPKLDKSPWPEVANTQYLLPKAVAEFESLPCLWLRGLLPSNLCL